VPIEWRGRPIAPFQKKPLPVTAAQRKWWFNTEKARLVKQGSLFVYPPGEVPLYVSNSFCVPKGSDSWRLVVNAKHVNLACKPHKCRYETLKLLQRLPISNAFAIKADLKDAYYQVPIAPEYRKFFAFEFAGEYYHLNCLPFGWLNSPWFFTKISRVFVSYLRSPRAAASSTASRALPHSIFPPRSQSRRQNSNDPRLTGARVLPYLDDYLFLFPDKETAHAGSQWIRDLLFWLGFTPHDKKCVWEPTQRVEHLGLIVDLQHGTFEVPAKKAARLVNLAKSLRITATKQCRLVSKQDLASFCGFAQSVKLAVSCAQLFLRSLYDALSSSPGWRGKVRLNRQAMSDLQWWSDLPVRHRQAQIQLKPGSPELYVDASKTGWGAVLNGDLVARGSFTPAESSLMIALLEMRAVRYALQSFADLLRDRCVLLREDNTCTESVIRNACSKSAAMLAEFRQLWHLADELHVTFKVVRVASAQNLADAPSRLVDSADYQLRDVFFQQLQRRWGPFDVDLFAAPHNALLSRFYSAAYCPGTSGVDAFMQPWSGQRCYGHPPTAPDVLLQVAQKLQEEAVEAVMVVPFWPGQQWFAELVQLADEAWLLPQHASLFLPGPQGDPHSWLPPTWKVVAFHIPPSRPG